MTADRPTELRNGAQGQVAFSRPTHYRHIHGYLLTDRKSTLSILCPQITNRPIGRAPTAILMIYSNILTPRNEPKLCSRARAGARAEQLVSEVVVIVT